MCKTSRKSVYNTIKNFENGKIMDNSQNIGNTFNIHKNFDSKEKIDKAVLMKQSG